MPAKLTTEQFIEKARAIHGDRYDYSQVEYVDAKTKVSIVCPDHGSFGQTPTGHLSGRGCLDCGGRKQLNTDSFIERAKEVHGDRYDYSRVEYLNNKTPVTIICVEHGSFDQAPSSHLHGRGCAECVGKKQLTTARFIEKAKAVHADSYDYSQVKYVNTETKVAIICPTHGSFLQTPNSHLGGAGCPDCGGKKQLTTEQFIEKATAVHGDRYDYSQVEYSNNKTPVTIICTEHGPFHQIPSNHIRNAGCPACGGNRPYDTETFVEQANEVHGNHYDYSQVDYINTETKVTIVCSDHGSFEQTPRGHLSGKGCPDCGGKKQLTTEQCIEKATAVHGDRYDYSQVEYVNTDTKVSIVCPDHGLFEQAPTHHLSGKGCPDCGGSCPLTTERFIERSRQVHGDRYDYASVDYVNAHTKVTIICSDHGAFDQLSGAHLRGQGCSNCADYGFNRNDPATLYYLAITTVDGDTRYKIGVTNRSVEDRFLPADLARIRIVETWRYATGRAAEAREAEILRLYVGDKYYGPAILRGGGNSELFTHDILGLDK